MYSTIAANIPPSATSTFALQVKTNAARLPGAPDSICNAIATLAAAANAEHDSFEIASSAASAPEWNEWAQQNGCPHPYPARPTAGHRDIAIVDAAVKSGIDASQPGTIPGQVSEVVPGGPQAPGPATDDTDQTLLATIIRALNALGSACIEDWAKQNPTTITATDALAAAKLAKSSIAGVGNISNAALAATGIRWAYTTDGGTTWELHLSCGLPDFNIPSGWIGSMRAGVTGAPGGNGNGGTGGTGGTETAGTGADLLSLFGGGIAPRQITVRRCAGPYRMAINERCYHKDILPDKYRLNKPKPAPVSHADAQNIRKGKQAAKRIKTYAQNHVDGSHTHHHRHR